MGVLDFLFSKTPIVPFSIIRATDRGEPWAETRLSEAFDKGLPSDEHNALRKMAYSLDASNGGSLAQYWMGFLSWYVDGNPKQAIYWYESAANQGNTDAMQCEMLFVQLLAITRKREITRGSLL